MAKNLRWYGIIGRFKKLHVNRKYKDRLFCFLFKEKRRSFTMGRKSSRIGRNCICPMPLQKGGAPDVWNAGQ